MGSVDPMRDPRAPIPSPTRDRDYWTRATPPPTSPTASGATPEDTNYDPTRLLRPRQGDTHGLDRRGGPRRRGELESDESQKLVNATHRRLDAILGLRTTQGWAVVRTLSIAPAGVLLHHLDLLDPHLDAAMRLRGRRVLTALAPLLGSPDRPKRPAPSSPLATVGTCVLSRRVVADVAAWATPTKGTGAALSSQRPSSRALRVGLVIPPPVTTGGRRFSLVEGELVPLNDPNPQVLAVALPPKRIEQLEFLLRGHSGSAR